MWLENDFSFPYPVLTPFNDDYQNGEIESDFDFNEVIGTGQVEISYLLDLKQPNLSNFIRDSSAAAGIFITCPTTYFSQLFPAHLGSGTILLAAGQLKERVILRAVIYTQNGSVSVPQSTIHDEYGSNGWKYRMHQFLVIGDQYTANVGLEKLAPMESIFDLSKDSSVEKGEVKLLLDGERVSIAVHPDSFTNIHGVRHALIGKTVLLSALYLPVVISILGILKDGAGHLEGYRWYRVFTAKCDVLGVDVSSDDLLGNAQKLLKLPLQRLLDLREFKS